MEVSIVMGYHKSWMASGTSEHKIDDLEVVKMGAPHLVIHFMLGFSIYINNPAMGVSHLWTHHIFHGKSMNPVEWQCCEWPQRRRPGRLKKHSWLTRKSHGFNGGLLDNPL
jgi:hypothetical protein